MTSFGVEMVGLRELVEKCDATSVALALELKTALLDVAEIVSRETETLLAGDDINFGGRTLAGIKSRVDSSGTAFAQQSLRKSRNLSRRRNNFGGLQMTHGFLPAIHNKSAEIEVAADRAVQSIVTRYFA